MEKILRFSERLKVARKNKGYTQEQIAEIVGLSKQAYRLYEQNHSIPREKVLNKICETLEVDSNYLFNTEILPYYQQLTDSNQEKAVDFVIKQLNEQNQKKSTKP